jgi:hypothetical protein
VDGKGICVNYGILAKQRSEVVAMLTTASLSEIVADVQYPGLKFVVGNLGHGFYIQVKFIATDNQTGDAEVPWSGRKWFVSVYSTHAEVVQTCLKAVLTALEHEAREKFTYRGAAIFQPHIDIDRLIEAAGVRILREER